MSGADLEALARAKPRSLLVRASLLAMGLLVAWAWLGGEIDVAEAFGPRRMENLRRFLAVDIQPYELRGESFDLGRYFAWGLDLAQIGRAHV